MSDASRLPYPGLRAYTRDETDLFFGRDGCTDDMVDRLAETGFLAVLGASGSGKSSLVKTGLLEALELGLYPEAGVGWRVAEFAPGEAPLRNFAGALSGASANPSADPVEIDVLLSAMENDPSAVINWAESPDHLEPDETLLVLVDQFEEIFRYGDYAAREEAEAFVRLLIKSVEGSARVKVVLTMRSEYLGACALIPGLTERINRGLYLTPRMTRDECREAIEGPASVIGFSIEPGLTNRLLNDMAEFAPWDEDAEISHLERLSRRADQLPLMQHVLNRLWLQSATSDGEVVLRLADYERLGGLRGALDDHGEEILTGLGPERAAAAERVFRSLVAGTTLANATRRPVRLSDLATLTGVPEADVRAIVDAFRARDCCFLRPAHTQPLTPDTIIDISHESLVRQWSKLTGWFRQETEDAARWRQLVSEATAYRDGAADLLSKTNLEMTTAWLDVVQPSRQWARQYGGRFDDVHDYVEKSRAAVEAREAEALRQHRAMQRLRGGLAGAMGLVLVVGAGAFWMQSSQYRELQALQSESVNLVSRVSDRLAQIQDDAVIGFSEHEAGLLETIAPYQADVINYGGDILSQADVLRFQFNYARSLDRLGDPSAVSRLSGVHGSALRLINQHESLGQVDPAVLETYFDVVLLHSWNLMDTGQHDRAEAVLNTPAIIASIEADQSDDVGRLSTLARVSNARSRWYDEDDQQDVAKQESDRALAFIERARALDPDNPRLQTNFIVYARNAALQSENLADVLPEAEAERIAALETRATALNERACQSLDDAISKEPLIVASLAGNVGECARLEAERLRGEERFDEARTHLNAALVQIDRVLASDPDALYLQSAKLRLLSQLYRTESSQNFSRTPEVIAAGERFVDYWLHFAAQVGGSLRFTPMLDYTDWLVEGFLGMDGAPADYKIGVYRQARAAVAPGLERFPGSERLRELDANAANQLADALRERDGRTQEVVGLYQEVTAHYDALGAFDAFEVPSETFGDACQAKLQILRFHKERKAVAETLGVFEGIVSRCAPIIELHPWDFYLRSPLLSAHHNAGELLFEVQRYDEARPILEYASHWGEGASSRYLERMYRLGLGVERDLERARSYADLASRQSMKRFTVPAQFGATRSPFHVYVRQWPDEYPYRGIDDQVRWLEEYRGGEVPADVINSFRRLHEIARQNDVSFPDLAIYALGSAQNRDPAPPPAAITAELPDGFEPNPAVSTDANGVAVGGLDMVAALGGELEIGAFDHFVVHDGAVWLFASEANRAAFEGDPERYVPAFGGFCAYCLSTGAKLHPNIRTVSSHEGHVYFFRNAVQMSNFNRDPEGVIGPAEPNWANLQADAIDPAEPYTPAVANARRQDALIERADAATRSGALADAHALLMRAHENGAVEDDAVKGRLVTALGNLSWQAVLAGDDEMNLQATDLALELDDDQLWIAGNRAFALMLTGEVDDAREIFMRNRGALILNARRLWDEVVLEDFDLLREQGREHPLMAEIESVFQPTLEGIEVEARDAEGPSGDQVQDGEEDARAAPPLE